MDLVIRRLGKAVGVILPPTLIASLNLKVGQQLKAEERDGVLLLRPQTKKYSLGELLALCEEQAPAPSDINAWDAAPFVGAEAVR
ncbi:PbsX family transcriptional regulator [Thauera sp. CAU 1555]|uniref:PbsX family transcriptional regulator n=1 Tax=Thauera sedimentorum TaxID=2767595 RepID=A0ABR9BDD5_9RHOO|nr:PbsX family transcriptional regulator [Thauera sedimentorum]MBC9073444.1 PbsX family transcriptional regulator [Thauera sedimentorum]MBD8504363.1 PbsX family transcriptional regulator [Thauera sedimentorum]